MSIIPVEMMHLRRIMIFKITEGWWTATLQLPCQPQFSDLQASGRLNVPPALKNHGQNFLNQERHGRDFH